MQSKNERPIENDSSPGDLSLSEQVFEILQIFSGGFKPSFFADKDLSALSLTSKTLRSVVSPELKRRKAKELLTYVVWGEQDKAEAIIKANPALLSVRSNAVDPSERTIVGTAFQAAIGAGDKPMWEMMLPYFESLEQGETLRQFQEQFPKGIEDDVSAEKLKYYYNALAFAIIKEADHGLSAIERFRNEITFQKEIRQGKHFNLQHLIAAYQAYIDNADALGNWNNRDLFWTKVIGYVQRQLSAYDAQVHCSGIGSVLYKENTLARRFEFFNGRNFFPLKSDSGLGFDFACFSYSESSSCSSVWGMLARQPAILPLKNYVGQKQRRLQGLEHQLNKECITSPINYS